MGKNVPVNAGDVGLIPGLGRSPGGENSNPLQYSCLGNPMDRGAWRAKNADPTLTAIVTNHFNRLHLIKRYDEEVIKNYSEIELTIKTVCKGKSLNDALQYLKDYLSNINNDYGLNHHYVAMLRCMIGSPIYHAYLQSIL